jgi:hypothetical protein
MKTGSADIAIFKENELFQARHLFGFGSNETGTFDRREKFN